MPRIAPRPVLLIEALNGNPDEILNEVYARGGPSTGWDGRGERTHSARCRGRRL